MNSDFGTERVKMINLYLTPLSFILVLMAIIFSQPMGLPLYGSVALLGAALMNNMLTAEFVSRVPGLRTVRMIVNVAVNILLVYLLVPYWGPIWYLFLMTPVATAVYAGRLKTFLVSLLMSGILAAIYALRGVSYAAAWGQAGSRFILIIFLSLFVNALVNRRYPAGRK